MKKKCFLVNAIMVLLLLTAPRLVLAVNVEFSAFGDMSYGYTSSDPADTAEAALFAEHGTDASPLSQNDGFGNVGVDFVVLVELNDTLSFLSEVNLQLERGGSSDIGLDLERTYLDYRISNGFNVQVGSFFTPIGFHNRTLYSRAWLQYSIQIPDFDEEELGFVPNHSTGIHVYGNFSTMGAHSLNYAVSASNSRGEDPITLIINRDDGDRKTVTWLLEWVFPSHRDFRIGLSGWVAQLNTRLVGPVLGNNSDPTDTTNGTFPGTGAAVRLDEIGFNPYLVLFSEHFNLTLEYASLTQDDDFGNLSKSSFDFTSFIGELSLNLMEDRLHPYVRYDVTDLPGSPGGVAYGGPYLTLRDDDGTLTRKFIPEMRAIIVGAAYDLYALNRIKLELVHSLDGPRAENVISIQSAWAF
ncbi:hypothetical protein JYT87_03065 [Nitrospira defluvii]|nr:hypothetical protein [Nitrospira defluvii]